MQNAAAESPEIAFRSLDGSTYFDQQDYLGTERMRTNYAGAVAATFASLPWGDGSTQTVTGTGPDQDNDSFAGLDLDPESNTQHAQFRNYSTTEGRWLSPDPYNGSYDFTNPQSFNRYAYALNNPLSFVDPSGLDIVCTDQYQEAYSNQWEYDSDGDYWYPDQVETVTYAGQTCINTGNPDVTGAGGGSGGAGGGGNAPNNPILTKGPKSAKQQLCEDNLFGASIVQGIGSALGVGVPGSDPAGDIASAAKSAASSPAVRATAGVMAAQLGSALLTRAGAARLGALISEEFVPGLGWAAGAYIGYTAFRDAMSYYDDNVASCSE